MMCPKCGREAIDIRNYPRFTRENGEWIAAKAYVHKREAVGGLVPHARVTDFCIVRENEDA